MISHMDKICLMASVSCVLLLAGCARASRQDSLRDTRLQYTPQVNKVDVVVLKHRPFSHETIANGHLTASRRSPVSFRGAGVISEISVSNGQWVSEGTVMARLEDTDKRMSLESSRLVLDKAELDLYTDLAGLGYPARDTMSVPKDILAVAKMRSGYTGAQISLRQAQLELDATVLRAPFSGKVADLAYKSHNATGSDPFCTLVDDRSYDVEFNVFESELPYISKGKTVRVSPFSRNAESRTGTISSVNPTIDSNGQILVKASVKGDSGLMDGMNVRVTAESTDADMLVVPKSAVVIRDNLEVLFRYSMGHAEWVYVHTLAANSGEYAVEANSERSAHLAAGDTVIVSGNLNLADGSTVSLRQ